MNYQRRFFLLCTGLSLASLALAAEPPSQQVTAPTMPGQTLSVKWSGAIQPGMSQGASLDSDRFPPCSSTEHAVQLDTHQIQLNLPSGLTTVAGLVAHFSIEWDDANQDIDFAVLRDGQLVGSSMAGPADPREEVTLDVPLQGNYELTSCSALVTSPTTYRGKLVLVVEQPDLGAPAVPAPVAGEPRYLQQTSPPGFGESIYGEMSVGFNPATGRYLLLNYLKTMRMTLAEHHADPLEAPLKLPENCEAIWEDVSFVSTSAVSQDPILTTDPQTGRTFVSQLAYAGGDSVYAYSDDDGDHWKQGSAMLPGGHDHETLASGPYVAGQGSLATAHGYPNVVTYCTAEPATSASCVRSDDGGLSFGAPVVINSLADCSDFFGLLGHLRYGSDGTIYIPNARCNSHQVILVSEDSGRSYKVRGNHYSTPAGETGLGSHAAVAVSQDDNALYHCYINQKGQVHVSVSHDKARSWDEDSDIGEAVNMQQALFPAMVAGDADRASCAFVGTTTTGNYESADFPGIWHVYMATTYDGGKSWRTVIASPGNPVQGVGGICTSGTTCGANRNLLDFNEMVMDTRGYPLYAYDDGCVGLCDEDPMGATTRLAKASFTRQVGGRGLLAQLDPAEPAVPHRTCLTGSRYKTGAILSWPAADSAGNTVIGYKVLRGETLAALSEIATVGNLNTYTDVNAEQGKPYYYKVSALNNQGESLPSNAVLLQSSRLLPPIESACSQPGIAVLRDIEGDAKSTLPAHDLQLISVAEPADLPEKIVVTMKVVGLSHLSPNTLWVLRFHAPTSPRNGEDWFVGMHTGAVTPKFVYGTVNTLTAGIEIATTYTIDGAIDAASHYDSNGTITLVADKAIFGLMDGVVMSNMTAATRLIMSPVGPSVSGYTVMDDLLGGGYVLAGNQPCNLPAEEAPVVASEAAPQAAPAPTTATAPTPAPSFSSTPAVQPSSAVTEKSQQSGGSTSPLLVLLCLAALAQRRFRSVVASPRRELGVRLATLLGLKLCLQTRQCRLVRDQ